MGDFFDLNTKKYRPYKNPTKLGGQIYSFSILNFCFSCAHISAKCSILILVAAIIFDIVLHDGQRGLPSGKCHLLLLNVVASSPLNFANPEQDKLLSLASRSIAFHIILCFIISLLYNQKNKTKELFQIQGTKSSKKIKYGAVQPAVVTNGQEKPPWGGFIIFDFLPLVLFICLYHSLSC